MHRLTGYLVTDLGAVTRGRSVWNEDPAPLVDQGVGWVPVNQLITPFDTIPAESIWGSHGDLRLLPDPATEVALEPAGAEPLRFFLSDLVDLELEPWPVCARGFLKRAAAALEARTGYRALAAFEHEFMLVGDGQQSPANGFSLVAQRQAGAFPGLVMSMLQQAGIQPEMFLPEFSGGQFEITCAPADALAACDRAVVLRELVREAARISGRRATFAPILDPDGLGNGVHLHFSLVDAAGTPVLYDQAQPASLSSPGQSFAAGIVSALPEICALLAGSAASYYRLQPHRWSSAYACLGDRNREAALRICPVAGELDRGRRYNLELRPVDATANPYLALGATILAGLDGIERGLPMPALVNGDPSELDAATLDREGLVRLPLSLGEALERLRGSRRAQAWLGEPLLQAFLTMKAAELAVVAEMDPRQVCRRYADVY